MDADGSNAKFLTKGNARYPTWSPDGGKIAFSSDVIIAINSDGSNRTELTDRSSGNGQPAWSPDGSKIAFISDRNGNWEVYVMNANGSNQVRLTNTTARELMPRRSPDGSKIVFMSERDGNGEIYVMNADGRNQINLTHSPEHEEQAAWSPDGNKIAFNRGGGRDSRVYIMNSDGTGQQRVSNTPGWWPDWQPIPTTHQTVSINEFGFSPQQFTIPLGSNVGWDFTGSLEHAVSDGSGVGLFGSGDVAPGGAYAATFFAAGTFTALDPGALQFGKIRVPIRVTPVSGPAGTEFTVKWSSMAVRSGFFFDVDVKLPGSTSWLPYLSRVTTRMAKVSPTKPGMYAFRARLRGNGHTSGWSPVRSFTVN
jgi:plastocyanin